MLYLANKHSKRISLNKLLKKLQSTNSKSRNLKRSVTLSQPRLPSMGSTWGSRVWTREWKKSDATEKVAAENKNKTPCTSLIVKWWAVPKVRQVKAWCSHHKRKPWRIRFWTREAKRLLRVDMQCLWTSKICWESKESTLTSVKPQLKSR